VPKIRWYCNTINPQASSCCGTCVHTSNTSSGCQLFASVFKGLLIVAHFMCCSICLRSPDQLSSQVAVDLRYVTRNQCCFRRIQYINNFSMLSNSGYPIPNRCVMRSEPSALSVYISRLVHCCCRYRLTASISLVVIRGYLSLGAFLCSRSLR
jgi:hypothetical protein